MSETRELKWSSVAGTDWLHIGEWTNPGNTIAYSIHTPEAYEIACEWRAFPDDAKRIEPNGPETGAAGRRAAENALVDAGVITRAEADGLTGVEYDAHPKPDALICRNLGFSSIEEMEYFLARALCCFTCYAVTACKCACFCEAGDPFVCESCANRADRAAEVAND